MKLDIDKDWLTRMADIEANCIVSAGVPFSSGGPTVPKSPTPSDLIKAIGIILDAVGDTVGENITASIPAVYIERTKGAAPIKGK